MKNLINFILRNVHWLLFFLLLGFSVVLIVQNNQFQRSRFLSFFREISGRVYSVSNSVYAYVDLRRSNAELLDQLARLQVESDYYEGKYKEVMLNAALPEETDFTINYIPAFVVKNQINNVENYITINKGSNDGVERGMGVVSVRGIAGVVLNVSSHFSTIIPLLNSSFRTSCKIKHQDYFGPLIWDGKDPRYSYLVELPRYEVYEIGDTIVTSGHSVVFPEGIPVGIVVDSHQDKLDEYTSLKVELFTNFANLRELMVVNNHLREEQEQLEKGGIK